MFRTATRRVRWTTSKWIAGKIRPPPKSPCRVPACMSRHDIPHVSEMEAAASGLHTHTSRRSVTLMLLRMLLHRPPPRGLVPMTLFPRKVDVQHSSAPRAPKKNSKQSPRTNKRDKRALESPGLHGARHGQVLVDALRIGRLPAGWRHGGCVVEDSPSAATFHHALEQYGIDCDGIDRRSCVLAGA